MTTSGDGGELCVWLKAYDHMKAAKTGRVSMGTRATGSPMTYTTDGERCVTIVTANIGEASAYRLPG